MSGSEQNSGSPSERGSRFPIRRGTEAGVTGFFLVAVATVLLRDDLDPVTRYLSEYALGPEGWGLRLAFVLLGAASLNLVGGFLREDLPPDGGRRIGYLLAVWAGAVLTASVVLVDPQGTPVTLPGAIHLIASLVAFFSLSAAMAVAVPRFRASGAWRPLARPTLAVAVLTPLVFVLEASLFSTIGWVGVGQWLLFGLAGGWLAVLGHWFSRLVRTT